MDREVESVVSKAAALLFQSWSDLDSALSGIGDDEAAERPNGCSSVAWTVGHVTTYVDSWINVGFQRLPPNALVNNPDLLTGGSGEAMSWAALAPAVKEVRARARRFLESLRETDLDRVIPYQGPDQFLRENGRSLRHTLLTSASHHWVDTGEILTVRFLLGWRAVGDGHWDPNLA